VVTVEDARVGLELRDLEQDLDLEFLVLRTVDVVADEAADDDDASLPTELLLMTPLALPPAFPRLEFVKSGNPDETTQPW